MWWAHCACSLWFLLILLDNGNSSSHCSSSQGHVLNVTSAVNILNMSSGSASSYAADTTCEWLLTAPSPGQTIKVTVVQLHTECLWDRLYIYDGRSFRDKLIGVYSGQLLPRPIYATSGYVLIYFFSDYDLTKSGFNLEYSLLNSGQTPPNFGIGACFSNSDCRVARTFSASICDLSTSKCRCDENHEGLYCHLSKHADSPKSWHLMGIGSDALSRTGHRVSMLADTAYMFGGFDYTNASNQLYNGWNVLDFSLQTPADPSISPAGRYSHQMVSQLEGEPLYSAYGVPSDTEEFGEDSLFVHGGVFANGTVTNELWQYKVDLEKWFALSPSPLALADHVMVTVDNRWLFTHGGRSDETQDNPIGDMYIYDTVTGIWRKEEYHAGYEPSLRLTGHTAVYSDYTIYIYGGYTPNNARFLQIQNTLWRYHIRQRIWSRVELSYRDKPAGVVFHAAALYDNKMLVYGGRRNTTTAQCTNQEVYVFDLGCQRWLDTSGSLSTAGLHRPAGQHGHTMLAKNGMLYVYGGVQGSLTKDVIGVKISNILGQSSRTSCDPCAAQTTCQSCTLTDTAGTSCRWCPREQACVTEPASCRSIYWGANRPISNISMCLTENSPGGWYYNVYKHPANYSQPDEVHLAKTSHITWRSNKLDFPCTTCRNSMIARGYMFETPNTRLDRFRFTAIGNQVTLYHVTSNNIKRILGSLEEAVSQKQMLISRSDLTFGDTDGYIQINASHLAGRSMDFDATVGLVEQFRVEGFPLENLKPYSSGNCLTYNNCMLCSSDPMCGWCASQSRCMSLTSSCNSDSDWLYTSPVYCENCADFTNCHSCTESAANCEWLPDNHKCIRRGRKSLSIQSSSACQQPCYERLNCSSCLDAVDECIWCTTLSRCLAMDSYQSDYHYGECLHYQASTRGLEAESAKSSHHTDKETCSDCSKYMTCNECSEGLFCGWCSRDAEPAVGVCVPGDFSAPHDGQTCSQTIANSFSVVGDATWSFRECPDLLECTLGPNNCVRNADCIETRASFECHCKRGYEGVGDVSCNKTCYHDCVHGMCRPNNQSAEEFECECSLGWMGPACDVDCGCNYHSTCERGSGLCDKCHNYTTGATCGQCVANSHGNPRAPAGCAPCQCNGHGNPANECDSTSGVCNCIDETMGDHCAQCQPGYFGDSRDGGECFECYYGRTVIENFVGTSHYGSRLCHRGSGMSNATTFLWLFNLYGTAGSGRDPAEPSELTFELSGLDARIKNPVYIYSVIPDSVMSEDGVMAKLTNSDVGVVISSPTGLMVVVYFVENSSADAILKFKMTRRHCPEDCLAETSLCSPDNVCRCRPGYIGVNCQTRLECGPKSNGSELDCGSTTTHVAGRQQSAQSETDTFWFIHGGISFDGTMFDDLILVNKDSQSLAIPSASGDRPSPRYGHAMACLTHTCWIYGGVTTSAFESAPLSGYVGPGGSQLYMSHQLWELSMNQSQGLVTWTRRASTISGKHNKVIPPLSGHTLTFSGDAVGLKSVLVLIGGITAESIWNPDVYVYSSNRWQIWSVTGARPQGLVRHAAAFYPGTLTIYVIPGNEPNRSEATDVGLYILDIVIGVWSKIPYKSMTRRMGHYLFSSADFLVVMGGTSASRDDVVDSSDMTDSLSVYHYACARWNTYRLTNVSGNIQRGSIIGYSFLFDVNSTTEGLLLAIGSDQSTTTLLSSARIDLGQCRSPLLQDSTNNSGLICNTTMDRSGACEVDLSNSLMPCESIDSCEICLSDLPRPYQKSESKRCGFGAWLSCQTCPDSSCLGNQLTCLTHRCQIHSSCLGCTRTPGCEWFEGRCEDTPEESGFFFPGASSTSPSADHCSIPSNFRTCEACLRDHPTTYSHTLSGYQWNINHQHCLTSDLTAILDVGYIGNVVSSVTSCPKDCSLNHHCSSCQSQPHCGWCSVSGSTAGMGQCFEGTRNGSSRCTVDIVRSTLRMEVNSVEWDYMTCPAENECLNGHHTCDKKVQLCVDQPVGFKCECREGYKAVSLSTDPIYGELCFSQRALPADGIEADVICVPTCTPKCGDHGCCVDANVCDCELGYVGEQCDMQCECNGYSYCPMDDLSQCTNCTHHTTGAHCESCLPGFVGDPSANQRCRSCNETCNGRSETCEDISDNPPVGVGPSSPDQTRCTNCYPFSQGQLCESCKPGYFVNRTTSFCEPCLCNGHGKDNICDQDTGTNCQCANNTISSDTSSSRHQCDSCQTGYEGDPANNHQCYNLVNPENPACFDPKSSSACLSLPKGQAAYYALHLVNGIYVIATVNVRLTITVSSGVADIYLAKSPNAFIVTFDPETKEHIVTIDQSEDSMKDPVFPRNQERLTQYKYRRSIEGAVRQKVDVKEIDTGEKYATYHHFLPIDDNTVSMSTVMKLLSVRHTAVVVFPSDKFKFAKERFYVIVQSREDGTSGQLKFTQHQQKIHTMIFISVLLSALLLLACFGAIVWKMKRLQHIRQQMNQQQVVRHAMAARPFSSKIIYMDVDSCSYAGASNIPFNVTPLALEPIGNSTAVVATTFMLLPGDQSRPIKAAMASTLITWKLSFPPTSKSKERVRPDNSDHPDTEETAL